MRRGDLATVVQPGASGKPRPALILQSDLFDAHPSAVVLPVTSELRDAPFFGVRIEPSEANGLRAVSEIMVDKATLVPRTRVVEVFGRLEGRRVVSVERLLAVFLGLG